MFRNSWTSLFTPLAAIQRIWVRIILSSLLKMRCPGDWFSQSPYCSLWYLSWCLSCAAICWFTIFSTFLLCRMCVNTVCCGPLELLHDKSKALLTVRQSGLPWLGCLSAWLQVSWLVGCCSLSWQESSASNIQCLVHQFLLRHWSLLLLPSLQS